MRIEVVSHCLATRFPHYAGALCYHLSSIYLAHPTSCEVLATICCLAEDERTNVVLTHFGQFMPLRIIFLRDEHELGRRCIGRNVAAMGSKADVVWFSDVDQCFLDGIFDRLAEMGWPPLSSMIYPIQIMIHKDHATGDRATQRIADRPRIVEVRPVDFVPKRYNRAIGGVQIIQGDFARQWGYLNGDEEWQKPAPIPFGDFRDDVMFRRRCSELGQIIGVDLPGLYRIRHSTTSYQSKP
jgi:hypothetical protein